MADTSEQADAPRSTISQSQPTAEQLAEVVLRARRLALLVDAASIEIRPDALREKKLFIVNRLRLLQGALATATGPWPRRIAEPLGWIADIASKLAVWVNEEPLQDIKGLEYAKRLSTWAKALEGEVQALEIVKSGGQAGESPEGKRPEPSTLPSVFLTSEDVAILVALAAENPRALCQTEIELITKLSRKTVGKRLKILRQAGLTHRPHGQFKGEALTSQGRASLKKGA